MLHHGEPIALDGPPEPPVLAAGPARRLRPLGRSEAIDLLRSVSLGRVVFTRSALPAIRAVNHLVDADGNVIIRAALGAAQLTPAGEVVAYEADVIDPHTHVGWSVVVTGFARTVTDPALVAHYERLLQPWIGQELDHIIRVEADIVTGYVLTPEER